MMRLWQTAKRRPCFRSRASAGRLVAGGIGQLCFDAQGPGVDHRDLVLVLDVHEDPSLPSAAANSGLPSSGTVPATVPVAASMAVAFLPRPLNVKTR